MNLQLELYKFQREFLIKFPPKKAEIMQNAIQALAKDLQNQRTLKVDDQAPDFILENIDGKPIRLSENYKKEPFFSVFILAVGVPIAIYNYGLIRDY